MSNPRVNSRNQHRFGEKIESKPSEGWQGCEKLMANAASLLVEKKEMENLLENLFMQRPVYASYKEAENEVARLKQQFQTAEARLAELIRQCASFHPEKNINRRQYLETRCAHLAHPLNRELAAVAEADVNTWSAEQTVATKKELDELLSEEISFYEDSNCKDKIWQELDELRARIKEAEKCVDHAEIESLLYEKSRTEIEADNHAQNCRRDIDKKMDRLSGELEAAFPDAGWRLLWLNNYPIFLANLEYKVKAWDDIRTRKHLE